MIRGQGRRPGFTLVELLVVIAIIGALVALLLPAIQAARETARRVSCGNNLKQFGLALTTYHDMHRVFPTGVYGATTGPTEKGFGWGVTLLPHLELQPLYDQINPNFQPDIFRSTFIASGAIIPGGDAVLDVFRCPSSELASHATDKLIPKYGIGYATSDYKGCSGLNDRGMFCTVAECIAAGNRYITVARVTDGLTKTIAVGESSYFKPPEVHKWPFWIGGVVDDESALFRTDDRNILNCAIAYKSEAGFATALDDECAFSWHLGGAQFVFGDGSVHFLSETISFEVYGYLGTKDDGNFIADGF
jgi:prepilin-type N-terminal cleavage/methylation domain-containing protein